jgi:hypothetical protein
MVEHRLPKPVVAGSIPVSRSIFSISYKAGLVHQSRTDDEFVRPLRTTSQRRQRES